MNYKAFFLLIIVLYPLNETKFIKETVLGIDSFWKLLVDFPVVFMAIFWFLSLYAVITSILGKYNSDLNINNLTFKKVFSPNIRTKKKQLAINKNLSEISEIEINDLLKERFDKLGLELKLKEVRLKFAIRLIIIFFILLIFSFIVYNFHFYYQDGCFIQTYKKIRY